MRENRLIWFGHVQRKTFNAPMRRIESIIMEDKRSRRRLRRTWEEQRKNNLHDLHLSEDLTRDMGSWRRLVHVFDYWDSFTYQLVFLFLSLPFYISFFYSFLFIYLFICILFYICFCLLRFSLKIHRWIFLEFSDSLVALSFMRMSCCLPSLLRLWS